jgi:hypothetical protein
MKRTISDNVTAMLKTIFGAVRSESVPISDKIDSARMSHTRLKALEKPVCAEQVQLSSPIENLTRAKAKSREVDQEDKSLVRRTEEVAQTALRTGEIPKLARSARAANVSHYRLAAYAAQLGEESAEQTG